MMENALYYLRFQGCSSGPYSELEIQKLANLHRLEHETLIYFPQIKSWQPLAKWEPLAIKIIAKSKLEEFVDTQAIKFEFSPLPKSIPWREKKKKFWKMRRDDPTPIETVSIEITPEPIPEIAKFPERPHIPPTQHEFSTNAEAAALADPLLLELWTNSQPKTWKKNITEFTIIEKNFHKALFYIFLFLGMAFAFATYWLYARPHPSSFPSQPRANSDKSKKPITHEPIISQSKLVNGVLVKSLGEADIKKGDSPALSPTNPLTPPPSAAASEPDPTLKPPIRPKRD